MPRFITVAALTATVIMTGFPRTAFSLSKETAMGSVLIVLVTPCVRAAPLALALVAGCLPSDRGATAPPTIVRVVVEPATVMVPPGESQAFTAYGAAADGRYAFAAIEWSATGGTITPAGYFTADSEPGTFAVAASSPTWGLSGAASVRVSPRRVAAVAVQPGIATMPIEGSWPFRAILRDSAGIALDRGVRWASAEPSVAIVDDTGLVTGIAPGTALITATTEGVIGSGVITVVPPGTGPWPNEPRGFTVIADNSFNELRGDGWYLDDAHGLVTLGVDPLAPGSAPGVLQYVYPIGFEGGNGPGAVVRDLPGLRQVYVGLWWKPSDPWQGHSSNVNKIQFLFPQGGGDIYLAMYGSPGGPYELRALPQFPNLPSDWLVPNVTRVPVALGRWHRVEWLLIYNTTTTPANGIVRWWLDGELVGDHWDVEFPSGPMVVYKASATWGGVGGTKSQIDYYWYDHVHISGR